MPGDTPKPLAPPPGDVTRLLAAWGRGDTKALEELIPLVYDELHRLAQRYMNQEPPGHTLQTTALVNEAYLRLIDQPEVAWQDRAHFFAVAARIMRHLLIDRARGRKYAKRGGGAYQVALDEAANFSQERAAEFVALDEALQALAEIDPRKSQIVELRYFGGLSIEETAEVLKLSPMTVKRDWKLAKAWLHRELSQSSKQ